MLRRFVGANNASAGSGGGAIDDSMRTNAANMVNVDIGTEAAAPAVPKSTQIFCSPAADPVATLKKAQNDIAALTIFVKEVEMTKEFAASFIPLIRGDNRSWEAIAVDILRQKARWESITFESCKNNSPVTAVRAEDGASGTGVVNFMDVCVSFVLTIDNCNFLHLSNMLVTEQLSKSFYALAFSRNIQKLQLDLIDFTATTPLLAEAIKQNKSLTCLIASRCGLQDPALKILIEAVPSQLKELRIFGNKCRGLGLNALAKCLQDKKQSLEILDISFQHVSDDDEAGPFDIAWLAAALKTNKILKVLDMDNDNLDDGHFAHIVAALEENETLEELMLNHNKISGAGVALMASKFNSMKGLKKISMYSNAFG